MLAENKNILLAQQNSHILVFNNFCQLNLQDPEEIQKNLQNYLPIKISFRT